MRQFVKDDENSHRICSCTNSSHAVADSGRAIKKRTIHIYSNLGRVWKPSGPGCTGNSIDVWIGKASDSRANLGRTHAAQDEIYSLSVVCEPTIAVAVLAEC